MLTTGSRRNLTDSIAPELPFAFRVKGVTAAEAEGNANDLVSEYQLMRRQNLMTYRER